MPIEVSIGLKTATFVKEMRHSNHLTFFSSSVEQRVGQVLCLYLKVNVGVSIATMFKLARLLCSGDDVNCSVWPSQ